MESNEMSFEDRKQELEEKREDLEKWYTRMEAVPEFLVFAGFAFVIPFSQASAILFLPGLFMVIKVFLDHKVKRCDQELRSLARHELSAEESSAKDSELYSMLDLSGGI